MSLTLRDILDRLKKLDEISLLEVLDLSSEDIVERFVDRIEDKWDELEDDLVGMLDDEYQEENEEI